MIYLILTLLCFLVYWPSLRGPLRLHDDQGSILARKSEFESYRCRSVRWWLHKLVSSPSRPVYNLVNYLQFRVCGFWPPAWHFVNYALHVVSTCTLLHTLNRLGWDHATWLSVAFAVHPLQTASVNYISGRSGVIAGFFLLLFVNCYLWPFPWCLIAPVPLILAYDTREDSIIALTWMPFLEWFR